MDVDEDPARGLAGAVTATGGLVDAVAPDAWSAPTPCGDWQVRDLVGHLVLGHRLFAAALVDRAARPDPSAVATVGDLELPAAYRESSAAMVAAFRAPGALVGDVTVPFGTIPATVALQLRVVEALVHGWDLARATGRGLDAPDELVAGATAFTERFLGSVPPGRTPFGAPRPAPQHASPLDRLAALLGRT